MPNTTPSVAVITRTKDRPLLLKRAIQSVNLQSYTDLIHVVINDGGDPTTVDNLMTQWSELPHEKVRVIHNRSSSGMEAASNKAIKSIDSKYVAIHDDDDTWHQDFLKLTVSHLESSHAMGVVVRTDKILEEISNNNNSVKQISRNPWMPDLKVINLYRQCIDNQMTPITFLYRRAVYEKVGYYDESLPILGDWEFGIRFLQHYDVDYLDPGFALANYHHRRYVKNSSNNNSFGDGKEKHRYYSNKIMNQYLRDEFSEGKMGVGYIMSKLKYDQAERARIAYRVMPKMIANFLKKKLEN